MSGRKEACINLDDLFRSGSIARRIADRLMTGQPHTRCELVEGLGRSVTAVNQVVARLQRAGVIVAREIGADGRRAEFRVVGVTGPSAARPCLHLGDRVRVIGARLLGDDMLIDVTAGRDIYRGVLRGVITSVNIGGDAIVQGIECVDDTLSNVRFEVCGAASGDGTVVLESVRNVTGT